MTNIQPVHTLHTGYCIVPVCGGAKHDEATWREDWGDEETQTDINRPTLLGKCVLVYIKKAAGSGAVQQDPLGTVLAHQAGVLLHLGLVAGAFAFAGVGSVGHDGPSVQHQGSAHVLQHPGVFWIDTGEIH